MQKYKVFLNSKFLLITNIEIICNDCIKYTKISDEIVNVFLNIDDYENIQIVCNNPEDVFNSLLKYFKYIEAAGGIVENINNEILSIFRLNHWDLPKGKIEKGELPRQAAKREVAEECGINIDEIGTELEPTYHIYERDNKLWLKKTFWYKMKYSGSEKLVPQTEEDITKVIWISKNDIGKYTDKMFSGIKEIIKVYL